MHDPSGTEEGDFHGYVGARWPSLVRTLVLLGCPVDLAPDAVSAGLRRCRRGWRRAVEHDDVDVVVHRAVLGAWQECLRGPWWTVLGPRADDDWPLPDLSALDRLTPEIRAGLVLRRYAALDPSQAVAVAGREAGGPLPADPDAATLRAAAERVVVFSLPVQDDVAEDRSSWRRRRSVATVAGIAAVALVLGLWTWRADDDEPGEELNAFSLDAVEPNRSRNPADVAWFADDVLHLANATYVVDTLRDLAVLGAGAVYGDVDGRVVHLADDGTRRLLGTKDPGAPLVASDDLGWVAWVDPAGANPRLLVYDVGRSELLGELDLPPGETGPGDLPDTRPVAIDQETVYFATADGARAWRPVRDPGRVEVIEPAGLVDVSSANRVFQVDHRNLEIDQPFFNLSYVVPGRGGEMSLDGNYLTTRSPDDGSVLVYDTRSGEQVPVEPPGSLRIVDVVLAPEGAITYLTVDPDGFATQEGNDSNPVQGELVTCDLDDGQCEVLASFVLDSEAPILAH